MTAVSGGGVPTTVGALVAEVATHLRLGGHGDAEGVASDIVAACCSRPRSWPRTHSREEVAPADRERAVVAADRLVRGMPFAYAVGRADFRQLELEVDGRVLIPRPETELLVELVLRAPATSPGSVVADVGTGSGAIALSLAVEGPFSRVIATDVSSDAIRVARSNLARVEGRVRAPVEFRLGDGVRPLRGERLDLLVSNPPYIAFAEVAELPSLVRDWEPPQALSCADEGLAITRGLVEMGGEVLRAGGLLALEVDSRRAREVQGMLERHGGWTDVAVHLDFTGRERFVTATCARIA